MLQTWTGPRCSWVRLNQAHYQGFAGQDIVTGANCLSAVCPLFRKTKSPEMVQLLLKYLLERFINPANTDFPSIPVIKIWLLLSEESSAGLRG